MTLGSESASMSRQRAYCAAAEEYSRERNCSSPRSLMVPVLVSRSRSARSHGYRCRSRAGARGCLRLPPVAKCSKADNVLWASPYRSSRRRERTYMGRIMGGKRRAASAASFVFSIFSAAGFSPSAVSKKSERRCFAGGTPGYGSMEARSLPSANTPSNLTYSHANRSQCCPNAAHRPMLASNDAFCSCSLNAPGASASAASMWSNNFRQWGNRAAAPALGGGAARAHSTMVAVASRLRFKSHLVKVASAMD
mmetsp:Transcript_57450/g.171389  ORF Transcript_57450/g.171389 Transcript_57450/m.171389 type:complete len:252 (+) Transcript_57450:582-1337(+)